VVNSFRWPRYYIDTNTRSLANAWHACSGTSGAPRGRVRPTDRAAETGPSAHAASAPPSSSTPLVPAARKSSSGTRGRPSARAPPPDAGPPRPGPRTRGATPRASQSSGACTSCRASEQRTFADDVVASAGGRLRAGSRRGAGRGPWPCAGTGLRAIGHQEARWRDGVRARDCARLGGVGAEADGRDALTVRAYGALKALRRNATQLPAT
jgi:hypothetical protein